MEKTVDPLVHDMLIVDSRIMLAEGYDVTYALEATLLKIFEVVPSCPDRNSAIRKLREVYLDCASALHHKGKY